jgi:hypothetical protein
MAKFLDNSGDIQLDAVLTDYGRQLLARGDGSFNIVKFALGDDEIDYGLYGQDGTTTALVDKSILNTPVMEAFTNNAASMKSKLLTVKKDNLLFLPVLRLNTAQYNKGTFTGFSGYVVPVEASENPATPTTLNALTGSSDNSVPGGVVYSEKVLIIDQGLDSDKLSKTYTLKNDPMLYETEYNIFIDSRFGAVSAGGTTQAETPISVDDDMIAVYRFTDGNRTFVNQINATDGADQKIIKGHQGSRLKFSIRPSANLMFTDSLFTEYGTELVLNNAQPGKTFKVIRTSVEVVGVTTGYTLEIPVMFAKLK